MEEEEQCTFFCEVPTDTACIYLYSDLCRCEISGEKNYLLAKITLQVRDCLKSKDSNNLTYQI